LAWLVLGWEKDYQRRLLRQAVWRKGGNAVKVQVESLLPDYSKITKIKRILEIVLMGILLQ
jgi:hypothetical protein